MTQNRYNNEFEEKILRFREEARITRNHYLRQMYKTEEDALEATKQRFIKDERNIYSLDWLLREVEIIMLANLPHRKPSYIVITRSKHNRGLTQIVLLILRFTYFWWILISGIFLFYLLVNH